MEKHENKVKYDAVKVNAVKELSVWQKITKIPCFLTGGEKKKEEINAFQKIVRNCRH